MDKNYNYWQITWTSLWRIVIVGLLIWLIFNAHQVIIAVLLGLVFSAGLNIIVDFLEKKGLPRTLSVLIIFIALFLILGILFYIVIPIILSDLRGFLESVAVWFGDWQISNLTTQGAIEIISKYLNNAATGLFSGGGPFFQIFG